MQLWSFKININKLNTFGSLFKTKLNCKKKIFYGSKIKKENISQRPKLMLLNEHSAAENYANTLTVLMYNTELKMELEKFQTPVSMNVLRAKSLKNYLMYLTIHVNNGTNIATSNNSYSCSRYSIIIDNSVI